MDIFGSSFSRIHRWTMALAFFSTILSACKMDTIGQRETPSRYLDLPLFNPHMTTFECQFEANRVPPIDAQADVWFHEALSLDSADIFPAYRDYKKIVQLTRQAAERHHWKAMLNLASLYLAGHEPKHGKEDAVRLVEEAMRIGIPAAYDRMGTYYFNGTGVRADATRAYSFWQRAAEMGNPDAMAFLGKKMNAVWDDPNGSFWANKLIGIKMLECAFGQGSGKAAYLLGLTYASPVGREQNAEDRKHALLVLHEGVKFGSEDCASRLEIEFSAPFVLNKMLAPHIDKARAERYLVLSDALGFDPSDRFPNLDKVVPLPPAKLPPWNGDRDTLLNAARGVKPPPATPKSSASSQRTGRYFLDAMFALRDTGQETSATTAPMEGYWQPISTALESESRQQLAAIPPGLYRRGEAFESVPSNDGNVPIGGLHWRRWDTVRHNHGAVEPLAPAGQASIVPRPEPLIVCSPDAICPVSGTWQPWVQPDHPLHPIINRHWRQVWLEKGRTFPIPERDWLLAVPTAEVSWHLMDSAKVNLL